MTSWLYMDPELAAALALREAIDQPDLQTRRATQRRIWESTDQRVHPDVTLGYLQPGGQDGPPVTVRTYRDRASATDTPALIWLHGGGFALGFCEIDDELCSWLANQTGCQVFSPEYRLAPEHPFPAAFQDSYRTLEWLSANAAQLGVDGRRIAVGGASAGGNLAAATALRARDEQGPEIGLQLLLYPVIDDRMVTESMRNFHDSPIFDRPAAELMWDRYLGVERGPASDYAAPGRALSLAGLPPTYISTAELDPLRDEGVAFASRLIADGVETEFHHFPGTFHGFDIFAPTAVISQRARADYAAALKRELRR